MSVPSLRSLIADFDTMTHGERVRRMAELGRDEAGSAKLGRLLDALERRSDYEYRLALVAAGVSGDRPRILAAHENASAGIRSFASTRLLQVGAEADVLRARLSEASMEERSRLRKVLARDDRYQFGAELVEEVRVERGDAEAAKLLGVSDSETVRRLLPDLDYCIPSWYSLARRHPEPFLEYFGLCLRSVSPPLRDDLWVRMGPGVAAVAKLRAEQALGLIEQLGPTYVVPPALSTEFGWMTRAFPSRVAELLLRPGYRQLLVRKGLPRAVARNARFFAEKDCCALARALRENEMQLARLLRRIPPSEREIVFRLAFEGLDTDQMVWSVALLEQLPHRLRQAETRRILALRRIAESPGLTLTYSAFLPVDEARTLIDDQIRRPEATKRASGYQLMIACARRSRDPEVVGQMLGELLRLRNEQDPVRVVAAEALTLVPPLLFTAEFIQNIDGIVNFIVEAPDTSSATLSALHQVLLGLVEFHSSPPDNEVFASALRSLDRLAGATWTLSFGRLDKILSNGAENHLVAALLPRLERNADRERFELALSLASALGRRAWNLEELQLLLEKATMAKNNKVLITAVELWLASPVTRAERAQILLERDPSTITLDPVRTAAVWKCQYLLDPVLAKEPLRGRFLSGNVRYVPFIWQGARTWLPRQVEAYADALDVLIADPAKQYSVSGAIAILASLPGVGAARLGPYLQSDDVVRIESALAGLARTDTPQLAVSTLLPYANTDHASEAIYALRRCARFVPPAELGPALETAVSNSAKITSRKEIIRLVSEHRTHRALSILTGFINDPGTHRDLKITAGRAIRPFLDDEPAWSALARLVSSGPDEARSLLETKPTQLPVRHRSPFGGLVIEVTGVPDEVVRQDAFKSLPDWAPWTPGAGEVAAACVADLDSGPAWKQAAAALAIMFGQGLAQDPPANLVAQLSLRHDPPELDASAQRDRPTTQRLVAFLTSLRTLNAAIRARQRDGLLQCAENLVHDDSLILHEIRLRFAGIDWLSPAETCRSVLDRIADRPLTGLRAAGILGEALQVDSAIWQPTDLDGICDELLGTDELSAALMAQTVISHAGSRAGWSEEWRRRLRTLRAHRDPQVAGPAQAIFCAPE